jgi:hypothetical protein
MRTTLISILMFITATHVTEAQNQEEWLQQNKTQKKYLIQQIAALKAFEQSLKLGYQTSRTGLSLIHHIKQGDWNLHHEFLDAKRMVNPNIAESQNIPVILELEATILIAINNLITQSNNNAQLTKEEIEHIQVVCSRIKSELADNMDMLIIILNNNEVQISDDGRIKAIERLYDKLVDEHAFLSGFANDVASLSSQRAREAAEVSFSKRLGKY